MFNFNSLFNDALIFIDIYIGIRALFLSFFVCECVSVSVCVCVRVCIYIYYIRPIMH